jgi:hypothetical protein
MVSSRLVHVLKCYVLRAVLIKHKSVAGEMVDSWQVSTDLVADAVRRNDASCTLRNWEQVLKQDALRNIVEDLEAMHELGTLLGEENAGKNILVEQILDSEVALEMVLEKVCELILQVFSGPTLSE